MSDWLKRLKVGSPVMVGFRPDDPTPYLSEVKEILPNGRFVVPTFCQNGRLWNSEYQARGRKSDRTMRDGYLIEATPERVEKYHARQRRGRAESEMDWVIRIDSSVGHKLTDDQVLRIAEIVAESQPQKESA